ncbi:MAG: efflux RND transporter periplasmic adaptor subunit [Gemmatimonadota bacterium]
MTDTRGRTFTAAILATLAAGQAGCTGGDVTEAAEAATTSGRVVSVEVYEVQPVAFTDFVEVVGRIEADRDVTMSAEESGTIRQLLVEKGAQVRAGQPIARIDDRVLRPQAEQAAAEAALARETWERQRRLWEEDRVGSEISYLQARYRAETADAAARVFQERLERTVVRAPISGILDTRLVEVGTLVGPGTAIGRIIDTRTVKIAGGVPERYAGQIEPGTEVSVRLEGVQGATVVGEVDFVGASIDQGNRTFPIEVDVANENGMLKPGMIANVSVVRQTIENALVVPQEAVLRVEDGYVAYVAVDRGEETIAEARSVIVGPSQGNRVIIDAGLNAGDRIIVVGQNRLAAGDRLQIVQPTAGRAQ